MINPAAVHESAAAANKGKLKLRVAFNVLLRLRSYRVDIWPSMTDKDVPLTNNLAATLVS